MIPDFTILVAVDATHIDELRLSYATWRRHKPTTMQRPLRVICDAYSLKSSHQLDFLCDHPGGVQFNYPTWGADWPVRERMLAGFVFGVKWISTPYYMKLDADTIATGHDDWISPEWFTGSPAVIASPWGYTKPASQLAAFHGWSDQHPQAFPLPMPRHEISGNIAKHRRMISWCQFGNTDWTWRMAELELERLPIPSQDGFLSLCAARSGATIRYVKMKELGWQHIGSGGRRLREAAERAMELPI